MQRFTNGLELDESFESKVELTGSQCGFKVLFYSGMLSNGNEGYVIRLTSYAGNCFDVRIGVDSISTDSSVIKAILNNNDTLVCKLQELIIFAMDRLNPTQFLRLIGQVYRAGKVSGKNEVRKRFFQLMELETNEEGH